MFLASIERRSSRQSKDVLRVNRKTFFALIETTSERAPIKHYGINMDETPGRGKQSKICLKKKTLSQSETNIQA